MTPGVQEKREDEQLNQTVRTYTPPAPQSKDMSLDEEPPNKSLLLGSEPQCNTTRKESFLGE